MARKLSDADVAALRDQAAQGRSPGELADGFGVSRRHVGRILRGEQRQQIAGLDRDLARSSTVLAVERFLGGLELDDADRVLAETALALAHKLDQARGSETAAAAGAAPALARELVGLTAALRGDVRPPDAVDELRRRREARRLAMGKSA